MDNVLMTILGIFLAAILIFIFPLMTVTERNDSIAQSVVESATVEFVDKISISGAIKPKDYEEYIQKLESTSNTFDVEIEIQHLDENFGKKNGTTSKDLIGENERYSTFTTEILENIYLSDGTSQSYLLKKGDNVIITAKNTNKTMAQTLKAYVYKITGKGTYEIIASSSGMVINDGSIIQIIDESEDVAEESDTEIDYNEINQITAIAEFNDSNRPEKVIATLIKEVNGEIIREQKELNADNNWKYTWNLNKYDNQSRVKYTIQGNEIEGYDYLGSISTNNIVYLKYKYKPKVNTWIQNGTTIIGQDTNGEILVTLEVGDYINYDCTNGGNTYSYKSLSTNNGHSDQTFTTRNNLKWRVIGVYNNQLNIVSESSIGELILKGEAGKNNGPAELNKISAIYGNGTAAVSASSITVKDAIDLCKVFGKNHAELDSYGNFNEEGSLFGIYFTANNTETDDSRMKIQFTECDNILIDILFPEADMEKGFWFANNYIGGLCNSWGNSEFKILYASNLDTGYWPDGRIYGVRPVVTLKEDIQLENVGSYNGCTQWSIK